MTRAGQIIGVFIMAAALAVVEGCGNKSPTTATPPPPPPVGQLTSLAISGNTSLTDVGQTSQLTAIGGFSDGTTRDVTTGVVWYARLGSVATISPAGVLRTVSLGADDVGAHTQTGAFTRYLRLTVTPPGTFINSGRVREPGGNGTPGSGSLGDVLVSEPGSSRSARSVTSGDFKGEYTIGGLTSHLLTFSKAGYETAELDAVDDSIDVPLQRVVRIDAGASVTSTLAPHDMKYIVAPGTSCFPCRLIRVTIPASGKMHLVVAWTEPHSTLNVWANSQVFLGTAPGPSQVVADVAVTPGELVLYVGKIVADALADHVPFTVSTGPVTTPSPDPSARTSWRQQT